MSERVGHNVALAPTLQAIIANGRRRLDSCFDVAGFEKPPLLLRVMSPDPGKAIGLQLDANLELIGFDLIHAPLRLLYLRQDSQQILYMVADLMRDHVGLRELAVLAADLTATETPFEIPKECSVEIDLPIVRTVERTHGGLGDPACRARGAEEHDERWRLVDFAGAREDFLPLRVRAPEYSRYEFLRLIGWQFRLGTRRGRLRLLGRTAQPG